MSFTLNSGLKIFDVIEALWENPKSREELCEKLKNKDIKSNTETITKYLRTLRQAGFEIKTGKSKQYEIINTPIKNRLLKNKQTEILSLIELCEHLFSNLKEKNFLPLKKKLLDEFSTKDNIYTPKENYDRETLDNFCMINFFNFDKQYKFKVTKNKKRCTIIPIRLKFKKNGIFIAFYNEDKKIVENAKICTLKNIKPIQINEFDFLNAPKGTTFKITGKLRKNYVLREYEKAKYDKDGIYVTNFYEEKEELYSRLMKYGSNCEVIAPESDRKKFISKLKTTITHYKSI